MFRRHAITEERRSSFRHPEALAPLGASLEGRRPRPFILRGPRKSAAASGWRKLDRVDRNTLQIISISPPTSPPPPVPPPATVPRSAEIFPARKMAGRP